MGFSEDPRTYVIMALDSANVRCPEKYIEMLLNAEPNRVIDDFDPWIFAHDPKKAVEFCSEAVGRDVLPFAQAIDEDMMACFDLHASPAPAVIVINPWGRDRSKVVYAVLANFDEWLVYAKQISDEVLAREQEELDSDD